MKAKEQEELRRQGEELIYKEKEGKILEMRREELRINDSIANANQTKINKGLQMLKEAEENLK